MPFDNFENYYWSRSRAYSPKIKEWLSVDPLIKWNPRKLIDNPGNWFSVRYSNNDPLNFVDPSGYSIKTWMTNTVKNFKTTTNAYKSVAGKAIKITAGAVLTKKIVAQGMVSPMEAVKSTIKSNGKLILPNGYSRGMPGIGGGVRATALAATATVVGKTALMATFHTGGIVVGSGIR